MDETRDTELGRQLETISEPEHGPEYWRNVRLVVAEAAAENAAVARRPSFGRRLRAALAPRRARLALAAVALAAVAAGVLLVGLPGTPGPQTVSAAQILDRALAAYSSVQTWQADAHLKLYDEGVWKTYHAYVTRRLHLVQADDGSYRTECFAVMAAGHRLEPGGTGVFDATTGKGGPYCETETRTWVQERNFPLGPPDAGTVPLIDIGMTVRALASSRTLRLDETVVDGRPAWTVTCSKGEMAGLPPSEDWPVYTVTVDKQTWLLLGVREEQAGRITFDIRYCNVRVNEPLPDGVFTAEPLPPDAPVRRVDLGFHRVTLDEAATAPGVTPLVPSFVPSGYELSDVAAADRAVITRAIEGVDVKFRTRHAFALQYRRGFDWLAVSTRTIRDPHYRIGIDLCDEFDQAWSRRVRTMVPIASGAFAGATARILAVSTTSAPHLWAMKDGVLLTIAGVATADELLAVAESLRVYPGASPAAE